MKYCPRCSEEKPQANFAKNARRGDGLQANCRVCQQAMQSAWYQQNKAKQLAANNRWRATAPPSLQLRGERRHKFAVWANRPVISAMYANAAALREAGTDCVVDHIVPLVSPIVCGLHVESNLQYATHGENAAKGNRHWPFMP